MSDKKTTHSAVCAMTVAGSDSGAGAGIQADLLAFAANGVFGCTAIAALTAQNPDGVYAVSAPNADVLVAQMKAICDYFKPCAAKTGMLFDAQIAKSVADFFCERKEIKLVVDPVMISTSGARLLKSDAVEVLKNSIIPNSSLFTPNLDEGAALLGNDKIVDIFDDAKRLREKFNVPVLLKGGHSEGDDIFDVLVDENGEVHSFKSKRINGVDTHGSGCTLSAAITANLAKGFNLFESCQKAQKYILACMKNPLETAGKKFINHFPKI